MKVELFRSDEELKALFSSLKTREDIVNLLEIDEKTLIYYLYIINDTEKYHKFEIKKKNGSKRTIHAPCKSLKLIQGKLNYILQLMYKDYSKPSAHGFINDKSIKSNAVVHIKNQYLINVDLKDFFPTINFGRVRGLFLKLFGFPEEVATILAQICCFENVLPQGAPTSPILSNFICRNLDKNLGKFSKSLNGYYTRYADDITLSSNSPKFHSYFFPDGNVELLDVENIIVKNGFEINRMKITYSNKYKRQEVTGLIINEKLNVRREYIKIIRALLYRIGKYGVYKTANFYIDNLCTNIPTKIQNIKNSENNEVAISNYFCNVMKGKISYLSYIRGKDDKTFLKYAKQFNELFDEEYFEVDRYLEPNKWMKKRVWVVDLKIDGYGNGTGFFLKKFGFITCHHVIESVKEMYWIDNPFTSEHKTLMSNGLFFDEKTDVAYQRIFHDFQFEIEANPNYSIGEEVYVVGYPQYISGNEIDIRKKVIVSKSSFIGETLYLVDGDIYHGSSGGPVLNKDFKVIGIIRAGIEVDGDEDKTNMKRGFVPISFLSDLRDCMSDIH